MSKITIFLLGLVALGMGIGLFFVQRHQALIQEDSSIEDLPPISEQERGEVLNIIRHYTAEEMIQEKGDFIKEESLINLVHVKRYDSEYKISCWFGSAYETANLSLVFPEELVSMGQIKECSAETAKAIDESIKSSGGDCRTLINSEIPPSLTDYYYYAITVEEREMTQNWINGVIQQWAGNSIAECFTSLEDLLGETIAVSGTGLVDLQEGILYY